MKPKRRIDLYMLQKGKASFLGVILALAGLLLPLYLLMPIKGVDIPRAWDILFLLTVTGVILSRMLHPFYHRLVSNLIALSKISKMKKNGIDMLPLFFSRWEAAFIKIAPLTDLTFLGLLGLIFLPGFILPLLLTFLSTNLWSSAADAVHAFYILRYTDSSQLIRWTGEGFEIWEMD